MGSKARLRYRIAPVCAASALAVLVAAAPAASAPKRITGKLSKANLTVIALSANGKAKSKRAKRGNFKLKAPAKRVTLHLRARDGTYAGPVVIDTAGRKKKKAILGVRAPTNLGKVKVRSGYAKLRRDLSRQEVDRKRKAKAKRGVPRGAGNFGRVRSNASGPAGPGLDQDRDGIPGALDIDDDGDLVLDNIDGAAEGRHRAGPPPRPGENQLSLNATLPLPIQETVNANATALTVADIDAALAAFGFVTVGPSGETELDCGGLAYCSAGGTGAFFDATHPAPFEPFPECCDADADGLGTLFVNPGGPPGANATFLLHGATTAQIGSGDVLIGRAADGSELTGAVQYVFATVPALVSYDDGQGNATTFSYPTGPFPPGFQGNGLPVAAGPGGDVVLRLTLWRPQRTPIAGSDPEATQWIDIGGLTHTAQVSGHPGFCPQSSFSEDDPTTGTVEDDPNLVQAAPIPVGVIPGVFGGGFHDQAPDQPANPGNVLTYSLNLTECLEAYGLGGSFDEAGEEQGLTFDARAGIGPDSASQAVFFERQ